MAVHIIQFILALPFSNRQKNLAKIRKPLSEDEFVCQILEKGGDKSAASLVFRHLSDWIYVQDFTPYPDDSLGMIYGIAEEELDEDLILNIFSEMNIEPPSKERIGTVAPVDTPLHIAQLVSLARDESHDKIK